MILLVGGAGARESHLRVGRRDGVRVAFDRHREISIVLRRRARFQNNIAKCGALLVQFCSRIPVVIGDRSVLVSVLRLGGVIDACTTR